MVIKQRLRVVLAVVTTSVALAACGGGGDEPGGTGELVVALPGDIDNFDPHTNQLVTYQYAVKNLVFSSLVKYDQDLAIVPDLATFEVNGDATQFTFELHPDAVFQDGTPVNAEAVVSSLERAAESKDSIWAPRLATVASYKTPSETSVVITLTAPNAAFLAGITDISILAPSNFADAKSKPVGSGPYSFVSWEPNTEIVLERFDDYFGEPGAADRIVEQPIADQQVALNNLYSGSVDVIVSVSAATAGQVDTSRATLVQPQSSNNLSLIEFNSSGTLSDPRVRQALAYAMDKDAIREIAYGGGGTSQWSPLPESSWAYEEQEGYPYDLDKARALLEEAGATDLSFTLDVLSGNPEAEQLARIWQESLAEIGVTMEPKVSELSVWLDAYVSRDYDAIWNSFNVGGDPNSFFDIIMTPHLGDDYPNKEVADLAAQAVSTRDRDERAALYDQLQQTVVDELPVLIVQSTPIASVASTDVDGYAVNPLGWALLASAE